MKRWLLRGLVAFVLLTLIGVGAVVAAVYHFSQNLPDNRALAEYVPPITTRLHANNGELIAEYAVQHRVFVPIEEIPPLVRNAVLAAEDSNFYQHRGIDFKGIIRAVITNVRNMGTGRRLVGGSTITQQVAKNFSLSGEVSYERKIKEVILAFRIERALPKDRILELYLNEIFLGAGAYGVAAAGERYFGKSLDELTVPEVAYLAGLPKAPSTYHPIRRREEATTRRNIVLQRMFEEGIIDQAGLEEALATPLEAPGLAVAGKQPAPWFAEQVRRELADRFGSTRLYEGGLSVRTSMDPKLQAVAQAAIRRGIETYDRRHGYRGPLAQIGIEGNWQEALEAVPHPDPGQETRRAVVLGVEGDTVSIGLVDGSLGTIDFEYMKWAGAYRESYRRVSAPKRPSDVVKPGDVVLVRGTDELGNDLVPDEYALTQAPDVDGALIAVDPFSGRMLAMVGGYNAARSEFNRAVQAKRQPGSVFKPFVYLTALNNGYTPASIIEDLPVIMRDPTVIGSGWKPGNFSSGRYYGPSPLRLGIELSRNLMTVRLAEAVGMDKVADTAERFAVIEDVAPVLAMALGAGETTLMRLTTAYAMLVNGGRRLTPTFIDRVQDRFGDTLYQHEARACLGCSGPEADLSAVPLPEINAEQVDDPIAIYQIVSMLKGVVDRGTATRARIEGVPLAGKTGTSNEARDTWFIGFSSDLAVGIFVGFDQPKSLGPNEAGGRVAAPIFGDFMREAVKLYPAQPFRAPEGVRLIRINRKTGEAAQFGEPEADIIEEVFRPDTGPETQPPFGAGPTVDGAPNAGAEQPATPESAAAAQARRARKLLGDLY